MSRAAPSDRVEDTFLLCDAVAELGAGLIGDELMTRHGTWPMYSKFFDYQLPLFHHLHLDDAAAARVGRIGKPEAYYFPPQLNNHLGSFPATYFGFSPEVTKAQVRERLLAYERGDNRITELSRAYRMELGTGWYTPPGVVHAPGSVLTYEPQWNSDVNSVYENVASGEVRPYEFLVENVPAAEQRNVDPRYREKYFRRPRLCPRLDEGCEERWIVYGNPYVAAKELSVAPGAEVVVRDPAAHGCIIVQGHGRFGRWHAEAALMLRFGQLSGDEYFVSERAARDGVRIANESRREPLVVLKHFGPNNQEVPAWKDTE
jgi:hypothetical protein